MEVAARAAEAGGKAALARWRGELGAKLKPDKSVVTLADTEAEAAIVSVIRKEFPDHAVLAEESGPSGSGSLCWIVDPLDGTAGFARGGAHWGPIIGLAEGDNVLAGACALPVAGRLWMGAKGQGAWKVEGGKRTGVALAATERLDEAIVSLGEIRLLSGARGAGVARALAQVRSVRCYGDVAGAAMLLDGLADAWVEAGVKPWDLAGIVVLVEEAGGRSTDFSGRSGFRAGEALAAGRLHGDLLRLMNQKQ